jgi:NADPH:quinone reductase-like Zn-dependent oxidoreductase
MRAWLLQDTDGPDAYALSEVPTPEPGPGEVRIVLRASALNHLDLWVARGSPPPLSFPHVSGADGAGVVDAVGSGVRSIAVGDEVVIDPSTSCGTCEACLAGDVPFCRAFAIVGEHRWGTHADAVIVPSINAVKKPPSMSWEDAGSFGLVTSSALRMLRRGRVDAGMSVLITGVGGGTATAASVLARAMGARVLATSRDPAKRAWALEQGAEAAFDSDDDFHEQVRESTGGIGVDVVIDNVGTVIFDRALRALARGGRYVTNGSTSGRTAELPLPLVFWRQLEVIGCTMNDHREFADAVAFVGGGAVSIPVDSVAPFDAFPLALERLAAGEQLGKIVLAR